MNQIERKLFLTDDWLARRPRLIMSLLAVGYVLVCTLEVAT